MYIRMGYVLGSFKDDIDELIQEDEEVRVAFERSDLLIRFAQLLSKYDLDTWSPIIKARFEKVLDDLEEFLRQGDFADKQEKVIAAQ